LELSNFMAEPGTGFAIASLVESDVLLSDIGLLQLLIVANKQNPKPVQVIIFNKFIKCN